MFKKGLFIVVSVLVFSLNAKPSLAITTYEFTGTVTSVNYTAYGADFLPSGITVGETLYGRYWSDGATSPSTNYFGDTLGTATYYSVPNYFELWTSDGTYDSGIPLGGTTLNIFVWNDEPLLPYGDGYLIQTVMDSDLPYYLNFGSIFLSSDTFSDESLPTTSINGTFDLRILRTETILTASVGPLIASNPVPVPPAIWLFGSGLLGLVGIGRKRLKK